MFKYISRKCRDIFEMLKEKIIMKTYKKSQQQEEIIVEILHKIKQIFYHRQQFEISDSFYNQAQEEIRTLITATRHHHHHHHYQTENPTKDKTMTLCRELITFLTQYVQEISKEAAKKVNNPEDFLLFYMIEWDHFYKCNVIIKSLLMTDNCDYNNCYNLMEISEIYWIIWCDHIFKQFNKIIADNLLIIFEIYKKSNENELNNFCYRLSETFFENGLFISKFMQHAKKLCLHESNKPIVRVFKKYFRNNFIEKMKEFYYRMKMNLLQRISFEQYINHINNLYESETILLHDFVQIDETLFKKWKKIFCKILNPSDINIVHDQFDDLLKRNAIMNLRQIFTTLNNLSMDMEKFEKSFENHIVNEVFTIFTEHQDNAVKCLKLIFEIHEKYRTIVWNAFRNLSNFNFALERAFLKTFEGEISYNEDDISALVKFCFDHNLKIHYLNKAMLIHTLIKEKDLFQQKLKEYLITSNNIDDTFIVRFKEVCEFNYKHEIEKILIDYIESEKIVKDFKQQKGKIINDKKIIEFHVKVLSQRLHPNLMEQQSFSQPPIEISYFIGNFTKFYQNFYTNQRKRKLYWLYGMSEGEMIFTFPVTGKQYMIKANSYQIAVLLHFNTWNKIEIHTLQKSTGLNRSHLIEIVKSILKLKPSLFQCTSDLSNLTDNSTLELCSNYFNPLNFVDISILHVKDTILRENYKKHTNFNENDRTTFIEAAIVRILKRYKTLDYKMLQSKLKIEFENKKRKNINYDLEKFTTKLIEKDFIRKEINDEGDIKFHYIP